METIKNSADFKKTYKGHKFYTKSFCVHYIKTSENTPPLFGFTISKKTVSKKAVTRNLVKRRIKSCLREYFNFTAFQGYKFVLTAIKTTKNASWSDYIDSVKKMQKNIDSIIDAPPISNTNIYLTETNKAMIENK